MQKALVIGSEGNVGVPLVTHLRATGYEVMETDVRPDNRPSYWTADMNQPIDLLPVFDWGPDVVFMLSAVVSRAVCEQASGLAVATNLAGINNVLQLCKRVGAHMVFYSSSEIYGPGHEVMDEATTLPTPNNRYGLTKWLGEQLLEYEVRTYGLSAVTLRPFMIYSEHEDFNDRRSAMIRFAGNLAQGKPIEVHRGSARGWLHVSDAVDAMERAAHVREYAAVNIGHPEIHPVEELADMIRDELGAADELVVYRDQPAGMTPVKRPSLERQREVLGVQPKVALREGVERVTREIRRRLQV
jgi:nucleoside-diphosphate-sugar epimerase